MVTVTRISQPINCQLIGSLTNLLTKVPNNPREYNNARGRLAAMDGATHGLLKAAKRECSNVVSCMDLRMSVCILPAAPPSEEKQHRAPHGATTSMAGGSDISNSGL